MNKWLVGAGLVGVSLVIMGYFIPWIRWDTEILGKTSLSGNQLSHRVFLFGVPPLAWSLLAMLCIFGAVICPTEKTYTSNVTKIIGVIVAMGGVITLIVLADAFSDLQTLAGLSPTIAVRSGYGLEISMAGGLFILLAGIFGMFTTEPRTRRSFKSQKML